MWDGNYYALEVTTRLGLEASGGMVRVGPVPQNRWFTTKRPSFGCAVLALRGTVEEIKKFGDVLGRMASEVT